ACHGDPITEKAPKLRPDDFGKAHGEVIRLMDELNAQRAKLRQTEARLQKALQRMQQVLRPAPHHGIVPTPARTRSLEVLERKLDALRKELDALKGVSPKKTSAAPPSATETTVYVSKKTFQIPLRFSAERQKEVREVLLYYSTDGGRTFALAGRVTPPDR